MKTQEKQAIPALAAYCLAGLLATTAAIPAGEAGHAKTGTAPKTYQQNSKESPLAPTLANVRYGEHQGNTLDSWKAGAEAPTPLIMILLGGDWTSGSKENVARRSAIPDIRSLLGHGISVAAINYRLIGKHADGVVPPVKAPLHDAARALQFIRSKARVWNIDKERIGAAGVSAGTFSRLWLLYHDQECSVHQDHRIRPPCGTLAQSHTRAPLVRQCGELLSDRRSSRRGYEEPFEVILFH